MLGLGVVAAIPGYRFGFKAKPIVATTISLMGQSFFAFLIVSESFRGLFTGTTAVIVAMLYVLNIAGGIGALIGRRQLRPAVIRKSMWVIAGLIFLLFLATQRFNVISIMITSWVVVLPPVLHGILAGDEKETAPPPAMEAETPLP